MKQSVLQKPLPNASLPRNGFDRGFEMKWNFSAGMALPVFCQPVLGDTSMRINRQVVLRAAQLQTASMARMNLNIDFFFVPFRQMFSFYGAMRTNTNDIYSSLLNQKVIRDGVPAFSGQTLQSWLQTMMQSGSTDMFGYSDIDDGLRLLDLLDYGISGYDSVDLGKTWPGHDGQWIDRLLSKVRQLPTMSAYKLLAYQKVWYDHYRISNYIPNDPMAYNADGWSSTPNCSAIELQRLLHLHYVPYRKDYFNNIYPSLNYAITGSYDNSMYRVPSQVMGASFEEQDYTSVKFSSYNNAPVIKTDSDLPWGFVSAQSIRALFALDKMTRLAAYAPKHIADQFEARFGFKPYAEDINESVRIGSFSSDMSIAEVLNQAQTSEADLGALGGRGFSVANWERDLEFSAKEDGIVIGIAYLLPRVSYDSGGIDAFNSLIDITDYPQPEFMNLGLTPVFRKELNWVHDVTFAQGSDEQTFNNGILGYQPMYSSWKIGVDRHHGLFSHDLVLSPFTTHTKKMFTDLAGSEYPSAQVDGVLAKYFYCDPADLNAIFAESYVGEQLTDQFFGLIRFKFDVVQNLSVHGQPNI